MILTIHGGPPGSTASTGINEFSGLRRAKAGGSSSSPNPRRLEPDMAKKFEARFELKNWGAAKRTTVTFHERRQMCRAGDVCLDRTRSPPASTGGAYGGFLSTQMDSQAHQPAFKKKAAGSPSRSTRNFRGATMGTRDGPPTG